MNIFLASGSFLLSHSVEVLVVLSAVVIIMAIVLAKAIRFTLKLAVIATMLFVMVYFLRQWGLF